MSPLIIPLLAALSFPIPSRAEEPLPCSRETPECLLEALTPPEAALLFASGFSDTIGFRADTEQYHAHRPDRLALTIAWRQRLRDEAIRLAREADAGQAILKGQPVDLKGLGEAYAAARASVEGGRVAAIFLNGARDLRRGLSKPKKKEEYLHLGREYLEILRSLALQDLRGLAKAATPKEQTDRLGRWFLECMLPAGGTLEAVRRDSPACRVR